MVQLAMRIRISLLEAGDDFLEADCSGFFGFTRHERRLGCKPVQSKIGPKGHAHFTCTMPGCNVSSFITLADNSKTLGLFNLTLQMKVFCFLSRSLSNRID